MSEIRGFEIVSKYKGLGLELPRRATKGSAGYDLKASEETSIPSIWKVFTENTDVESIMKKRELSENNAQFLDSTLVPTGIKAFMPENEYLLLANRSSNPMKRQLALPNGIGVIDSDYYNNENNEGEIFVQLINYGLKDYVINKGDRIAQGIFTPYLTIEQEDDNFIKRTGGFGSSDQ